MSYTIGYKAYNTGLVNRYGQVHEVKKIYTYEGELLWKKAGFHYCEHLEDTLRYYDAMNGSIDICQVIGFGQLEKFYDSYYDYEITVSDHLKIVKKLTREEIIAYANSLPAYRLCRFIQGFRLTQEEIDLILSTHNELEVYQAIRYYQYGDKKVYERK